MFAAARDRESAASRNTTPQGAGLAIRWRDNRHSTSHGALGAQARAIRQTVPSGTSRPYPSYISSSVTKCQSARSAIFSLVATLTSCFVNSIKLVAT